MAPKSQLKCPKSPQNGLFLDILIDFGVIFLGVQVIFPGGSKMAFFGLYTRFWGFGVPALCRGTVEVGSL